MQSGQVENQGDKNHVRSQELGFDHHRVAASP